MPDSLVFIVPGEPTQRTGGYLYDARVVTELRQLGIEVLVLGLEGRFPKPCTRARRAMDRCLGELPDGAAVVIDGLALGGLPELAEAHGPRLDLTALVHHPLADETGIEAAQAETFLASERRALAACRRVIVTSQFTARRLQALQLSAGDPFVVEPGVAPARPAPAASAMADGQDPTGAFKLLCVASLTPRKGHAVLFSALERLRQDNWQLSIVGSETRDPGHVQQLRQQLENSPMKHRIHWLGELDEQALERAYAAASLCVVPSLYEGYGMVVTEALARGLPLASTTGGALTDTVPDNCALKVEAGNVDALATALGAFLDDGRLRQRLCRAALARRKTLPSWPDAGRAFALALD
ncbi:MAG: glycosyltransferase family 4 protein [Wenzhouxiangella sp.]|nr:glycosyltransferase family 4 protein [Wenzhouxiangella sp.]